MDKPKKPRKDPEAELLSIALKGMPTYRVGFRADYLRTSSMHLNYPAALVECSATRFRGLLKIMVNGDPFNQEAVETTDQVLREYFLRVPDACPKARKKAQQMLDDFENLKNNLKERGIRYV